MNRLSALIARETALAWGRGGGPLVSVGFYAGVATLLPLFTPPVIFGGGALAAFLGGLPWTSGFALLGAYAAAAVALGPIAMAAACRNALS